MILFYRLYVFVNVILIIVSCKNKESEKANVYASLIDSTEYVGIETCKGCHADKVASFMQTGMGQSFDSASRHKSSGVFNGDVIHDKFRNLNYLPYWENDSLMLYEFRLASKDTIYKRIEKISWIVGSGQHTNSHMMNVNGYIYQAPATFYTQKKHWDLPPGFENGYNTRFSRMIGTECMTCHNAYPKQVEGSDNKYSFVANGIDCERCHGPGSKHVKEKSSGNVVDINKAIDYSIVNPSKLPIDYQLDVCQRCHIQGNAVLAEGKSFFDFRPGMRLSQVMDIYMPTFTGSDESHIMASHAERMKKSKCFKASYDLAKQHSEKYDSLRPYKNAMTCVTCHDPHVGVKHTEVSTFNSKCTSCHHEANKNYENKNPVVSVSGCTEQLSVRLKSGDNCTGCHMQGSGSIDIPHVTNTDHWIRVPVSRKELDQVIEFTGLVCINNSSTSNRSKAEAYLSYFEKFSSNQAYLDSAMKYLNDVNGDSIRVNFKSLIRCAFLKKNYREVIRYAQSVTGVAQILNKKSSTNEDAWTSYRIGESFESEGDLQKCVQFYRLAVDLAPYQLDFRNKLASALQDEGKNDEAKNHYEFIINENPKYATAYVNYGYLLLSGYGKVMEADRMYDKALSLDPDNIQALYNKAGIKIYQKEFDRAKSYLKEILKKDNKNINALKLLKQLS